MNRFIAIIVIAITVITFILVTKIASAMHHHKEELPESTDLLIHLVVDDDMDVAVMMVGCNDDAVAVVIHIHRQSWKQGYSLFFLSKYSVLLPKLRCNFRSWKQICLQNRRGCAKKGAKCGI